MRQIHEGCWDIKQFASGTERVTNKKRKKMFGILLEQVCPELAAPDDEEG